MTRRTDTVALVISESEERIFGEPFFAGVVRGISSATSEAGRQLVLLLSQVGSRTANFERYLSRQHVDGVLLLSLHDDDAAAARRSGPASSPSWSAAALRSGEAASVDVDNAAGARLAAEHLAASGRQRIATITGPLDMGAGRTGYDGFRSGLEAAGLELDDDLVASGDFSQDSGTQRDGGAAGASAGPRRGLLRQRPDGGRRPAGAAGGRDGACPRTSRWSASTTRRSR